MTERVLNQMAYGRYRVSYADADETQQQVIRAELAKPVRSADRRILVHGETRVFTNNLDRGVVDLSDLSYEWHAGENRWVPWFDVICDHDYKGNPSSEKIMQSDDRVAVCFNGKSA